MDFFGIGGGEILLILIITLIVLGPGKIVGVGQTMGKMMRILKKATFDLTTQISKEMEEEKKERPSPKGKQPSDR
ncbi:MAG: twin-arginine translocase TatA/TatE family subunit [Dehalococcoidia bacterium]|nr:MAG: twin-arginine translocase TatA/TatE family subunit [Dehalococcoidia bacterium]